MKPTSPRPSLTIQTRPDAGPFTYMPALPLPGSPITGVDPHLDIPLPATPPRQRARSTSPPGLRNSSAGPGGVGVTTPSRSPGGYRFHTPGTNVASPRLDHGSPNPGSYEPIRFSGGVGGVGKAVAGRMLRTVRRGNLPFLIVFVSCLILFTTSLAGIGYVPPDELARTADFLPGIPVFDLAGRQALERRMLEQKALENEWAKKKRPKDGAWMQRARDDRAIRRKPTESTSTMELSPTETPVPILNPEHESEPEAQAQVQVQEERPPPVQVELGNEEEDATP